MNCSFLPDTDIQCISNLIYGSGVEVGGLFFGLRPGLLLSSAPVISVMRWVFNLKCLTAVSILVVLNKERVQS